MVCFSSLFLSSFIDRCPFHLTFQKILLSFQRIFCLLTFTFKPFLHRNIIHKHTLRRRGTDHSFLTHQSVLILTSASFSSVSNDLFSHRFLTFVSTTHIFENSALFRIIYSRIQFCIHSGLFYLVSHAVLNSINYICALFSHILFSRSSCSPPSLLCLFYTSPFILVSASAIKNLFCAKWRAVQQYF